MHSHIHQALVAVTLALFLSACAAIDEPAPVTPVASPGYDAALAERLGADELGMRSYVLAILMTGPKDAEITDKDERAELFAGHFANMGRLAKEGKLVLAGPLGGEEGQRGLFILNTPDVEVARGWVATDPTIEAGVFTVTYNKYYGSAALMLVNEVHPTIQTRGITD